MTTQYGLALVLLLFLGAVFVWRHRSEYLFASIMPELAYCYMLLVFLSLLFHLASLGSIDSTSYITVDYGSVDFGKYYLKRISVFYLCFPLLILLTPTLFITKLDPDIYLSSILVAFLPSMLVGLYQGYVDVAFMNTPHHAAALQASGLGYDTNGFGLSLYFLFAICLLGGFTAQPIWRRVAFVFYTLLIIECLFLSGVRAALLAIGLFVLVLPWIFLWIKSGLSRRAVWLLRLSPLVVAISISIIIMAIPRSPLTPANILLYKLHCTRIYLDEGGITRVLAESGRAQLWRQAERLIADAPLAGWGPGGFYRQLYNTYYQYQEDPASCFLDSAGNHYLQIASELGILGAFLDLALHLLPLWMIWCVRNRIQDPHERAAVALVSLSLVLFVFLSMLAPYLLALDVLWLYCIFWGFLYATSIRYGYRTSLPARRIAQAALTVLTLLFVLGTYQTTFGSKGYESMLQADSWPLKYEKHCHAVEHWEEGAVRWCGANASLQIPVTSELPARVSLKFKVGVPDVEANPVIVSIGGKRGVEQTLTVQDRDWHSIELLPTEDHLFAPMFPNGGHNQYFVLSLQTSRTFVPKDWGFNDDARELGTVILLPEL